MSAMVRIPGQLYDEAMSDLWRVHPFALERVGFMYARFSQLDTMALLLVHRFESTPDDDYIEGGRAAATISAVAIRRAMQFALSTGDSVLHVHPHHHDGPTAFSGLDERELGRLLPSFAAVAPNSNHGAVVFSRNHASAMVRASSDGAMLSAEVSIVGYPLRIWERAA